jgi:peptidoglycan/xylan/chitin deacetylase (PgdA/CDA1 family)
MLKRVIKGAVLAIMAHPSVLQRRLHAITAAEALTILNLHRVAEQDGSAYAPLSPRLFTDLLTFLQKHFHLLTFSELAQAPPSRKPKLILSFDDGYRDFVDYAVPILEKHGLRVNQNVIPACIESGLPPLNVLAQDFIGKAPEKLLKELDIPGLAIRELAGDRTAIGFHVSNFLRDRPMVEQDQLRETLLPQFGRFERFRPTPMMTRAEIRQLATLHGFGAHSYSHATMGFETDAYFQQDLERCRTYFHSQLQLPATIYAFPNGSYREHQVSEALAQGFRHVLLVNNAFSRPGNAAHARFGIYGDSRPEILFRSLGGFTKARPA